MRFEINTISLKRLERYGSSFSEGFWFLFTAFIRSAKTLGFIDCFQYGINMKLSKALVKHITTSLSRVTKLEKFKYYPARAPVGKLFAELENAGIMKIDQFYLSRIASFLI